MIFFNLAIEAVEKLSQLGLESDSVEHVHGLICLAAQLAFEVNHNHVMLGSCFISVLLEIKAGHYICLL